MRKRLVFALLVLLIILAASPVFARGESGIRFGLEFGNPSIVLALRFSMLDIRLGYDFTGLANNAGDNFIFIAGDLRVVDNYNIKGPLNFFLCAGGFVQLMLNNEGAGTNLFGLRLPIGVNLLLFNDAVELFGEIVPTFGLIPAPQPLSGGLQGWVGFTFALP